MPGRRRGRGAGAGPSRSSEETGSSNQRHAELGEALGEAQRLLAAVGAVGVDEELGVGADRLAGGAHALEVVGRARVPIFIFTRGMPCSTQPPSCVCELLDRSRR